MKKIARKVWRKGLGIALALALFAGIPGVTELQVSAAEETPVEVLEMELLENVEVEIESTQRTMLNNCIISVYCSEEGMHVDFSTGCVGNASVMGVKDIVIMKKVWYGWKTVATSTGAESTNCSMFGASLDYTGAEYGETYRITCVHYADVDGYIEGENDTGAFVFTY